MWDKRCWFLQKGNLNQLTNLWQVMNGLVLCSFVLDLYFLSVMKLTFNGPSILITQIQSFFFFFFVFFDNSGSELYFTNFKSKQSFS